MADAFEILGLPPRFDLDLSQLEQRHRELSLLLHPDRTAGKSAAERRAALSRAMEVNQARRSLADPISRTELLLARRGVATGEGNEPRATASLLMEMMERREALRELAGRRDKLALERLGAEVLEERRATEARLTEFFSANESSDQSNAAALEALGALRYFRRFFDELGAVQDDLD